MSKVHSESTGGQSPASTSCPESSGDEVKFAICSDATFLLSTAEMKDRDLTGRTLWTGLVLTEEEVDLVRGHMVSHKHESASKIISRLPRLPKDPTNNP